MAGADWRMAESLDRYLDSLTGSATSTLERPGDVERELARTARLLQARDNAPGADPDFVERLLSDILADGGRRQPWPELPTQYAERASARSTSRDMRWRPPRAGHWPLDHWAVAQCATAALLVLTIAASLVLFGPLRNRASQDDSDAVMTGFPGSGPGALAEMVWESRGDSVRPLDNPGHLTLDPDGNLWVADSRNHGFQILSPDGELLGRWGTEGSGPGQFRLQGLHWTVGAAAFDAAGNLFVADTGNFRVQKFGPDRSFILAWGGKGRGDGQFLEPDNLTVDADGRVYVLDGERDDIQVFDANGAYLRTVGRYGTGEGQFLFFDTGGLSIGPDGNLWVADTSNQRIQRFSPHGELIAAYGTYGMTAGTFSSPNGIAVDNAGNVFVVDVGETGTRVQAFSEEGEFLAEWSEVGGQFADLSISTSLVLDGKGYVYVADYDDDRILKLRLKPPFGPAELLMAPGAE